MEDKRIDVEGVGEMVGFYLLDKYKYEMKRQIVDGTCFIDIPQRRNWMKGTNAKHIFVFKSTQDDSLTLYLMFDTNIIMKQTTIDPSSTSNEQLPKLIQGFLNQATRCMYSATDRLTYTAGCVCDEVLLIIQNYVIACGISNFKYTRQLDTGAMVDLRKNGMQTTSNARYIRINGWSLEHRSSTIEYLDEHENTLGAPYSVSDEATLQRMLKTTIKKAEISQTVVDLQRQIDDLEKRLSDLIKALQ